MQRITTRDLEALLARINERAGHGQKPPHGTPGSYCLAGAYGGYKLEQYSQGGGVRTISTGGYLPKRDLYNQMHAYLAGMCSNGKQEG